MSNTLPSAQLTEVFSDGGALSTAIAGYNPRQQQLESHLHERLARTQRSDAPVAVLRLAPAGGALLR